MRSCVDCFDAADSPFHHLLFPWGQSHLSHHSHVSIPEMEMIIIVMMMVAMINDWCWSGDKMADGNDDNDGNDTMIAVHKCCLYSIFSSRPNKLAHGLKFQSCYIIEHIFILARSVARTILFKIFFELQTQNLWFSRYFSRFWVYQKIHFQCRKLKTETIL